jgi:S-DNA-T family DNA segregation ATPase FtsK/SpoIIIE
VWKKYGESPKIVVVDGWRLPPIDILDTSPEVEFSEADNLKRATLIEDAFASYGVEAKVVQINSGPTVTQFGVEPGWDRKIKEIRERDRDGNVRIRQEEVSRTRVKVDKITSLSNDLALALAASSIRIEAPVPGKSVVGIEVPNTISSSVSLRGVIESTGFQKMQSRSKLALALGKGAGGEAAAGDLTKMPHLLIAGATGSGKTVCLNSIICCLLLFNTPNDIKFIMIDPKRVELTPFNSIPHLAAPVIVDTDKALNVLRWLNKEMDKRYQILASSGARNIESHNRNRPSSEKLPYLVLVIDELADLMMTGFDEVEHILCRLAQLARATGIHLVVATQRPSVDVVTGLIKANFPTRISFAVTSKVDSRTILDITGAEKLLGRGDMLYMPTEAAKPKRLQGCYVSDAETERLVYFWGSQRKEEVSQLKLDEISVQSAAARRERAPPDSLLGAARQLAREHKHISTSFLQRRLRIGYPRAARIMEQLEEETGEGGEEAD